MRRVVITGLGTVNSLGLNVETSFPRILAGGERHPFDPTLRYRWPHGHDRC